MYDLQLARSRFGTISGVMVVRSRGVQLGLDDIPVIITDPIVIMPAPPIPLIARPAITIHKLLAIPLLFVSLYRTPHLWPRGLTKLNIRCQKRHMLSVEVAFVHRYHSVYRTAIISRFPSKIIGSGTPYH